MADNKRIIYTIEVDDKGSIKIKELDQQVDSLSDAFVLLNNNMRENSDVQGRTLNEMTKQISSLKQQRDAVARTADEFADYNKQIFKVEESIRELASAQMSQEQVNANMIQNTGLASNTIVEFGRTISDAPFGIIGVTNNLANLANNFEILSGKVGGTKNVLEVLRQQLMKGGLFVLAIQTALALVTFFRDEIEELARSIFNTNKTIKEGFIEIKNESISTRAALQKYLEVLNDINATEQDRATAQDLLLKTNTELTKALDEALIPAEKRNEIIDDYISKQLELSKVNNEINEQMEDFDAKDIKRINKARENIKNTQSLIESERERIRIGLEQGTLNEAQAANATRFINNNLVPRIEKQQEIIEKREIDLNLLQQSIDLEGELNDIIETRIKSQQDIEPFTVDFDDGIGVEKFSLVEMFSRLMGVDPELMKQFDAVEVAEEYGLDHAISDLNALMKDYENQSKKERLDIAQTEALNQLEILYNQIEEETGLRIGYEQDKTAIEEYYSNLRIAQARTEADAKAKSLRVGAQATVQVGKLLQQVAEENKGLAIAGVVVEKAGAIAKIIANKTIADSQALTLLSNPFTAPLGKALLVTNKITTATGIAATVAQAAKSISEIKNPEGSSASSGAGAAATSTPIQAPAFNVVGATQTSQLAQTISQAEDKPIKAFVVASDVTTAQELERSTIEGASIG